MRELIDCFYDTSDICQNVLDLSPVEVSLFDSFFLLNPNICRACVRGSTVRDGIYVNKKQINGYRLLFL